MLRKAISESLCLEHFNRSTNILLSIKRRTRPRITPKYFAGGLLVIVFFCGVLAIPLAKAQELPLMTHEDSLKLKSVVRPDTMLPTRKTPSGESFRRPAVLRGGSTMDFGQEAIRYYGSPATLGLLLEEAGGPYPLLPTETGYDRDNFTMTNRTGEPFVSTLINGALPADDPLTGNQALSLFSLDAFSQITLGSGATALARTSADLAASDVTNLEIERFRAPVPFSRIHYTQLLATSFSNFDGLFSVNASREMNLAFSIDRRAAGHAPNSTDLSFNPRLDLWSAHAQLTYNSFLGKIHRDSTTTSRQIDSMLETAYAKSHSVDFLFWGIYTSSFSGLSGGISVRDSTTDPFDAQLASVRDQSTVEHRIRMDALAQTDIPLISTERTRISAYATYSSRNLLAIDTGFTPYLFTLTQAGRMGASLEQPLGVHVGDFLTEARLKGEVQFTKKYRQTVFEQDLNDTRLAVTASDSLGLSSNFGITLFGFVRGVQDNFTLGSGSIVSSFFPNIGFEGSIKLTNALGFTASYAIQKDRALLSPSPDQTYSLRTLGGYVDLRFGFAQHDSIALHAGVLDRHEPEGIVYNYINNILPFARFSNSDLHTQSATVAFDAYFNHIHFAASGTFYPTTPTITQPTPNQLLLSDLTQKIFGSTGLYYEAEVGEGNLRLSLGGRLRYLSRIDPQLTYDPAFDYFTYKGLASRANYALIDQRLTSPRGIVDFLVSMEIDRRAQVSTEFLNILSTPYYNVQLYPRQGFEWRIDVTWAYLD